MNSEAWQRRKRQSWAQLLMRTGRRLNELAVARVRATPGLEGLRPAHTALFPHLDLEGTRPSTLAERLGVTKQAVAPLVDELVDMGVLRKDRDPADGRAVLLRFSNEGGLDLESGLAQLIRVEQELAAQLGPRKAAQLHRTLLALDELFDELDAAKAEALDQAEP